MGHAQRLALSMNRMEARSESAAALALAVARAVCALPGVPRETRRQIEGLAKEERGKIYVVCAHCGRIVRLNKPVFGSLHVCTTADERRSHASIIAGRRRAAEKLLQECRHVETP